MIRNAAIVAANTAAHELIPDLRDVICEDQHPMARQHALWALAEITRRDPARENQTLLELMLRRALQDPDTAVQVEAQTIVSGS